jgi:hypothetical protein
MGCAVQLHEEMGHEEVRMTEWLEWRASLLCCYLLVLKLAETKQTTQSWLRLERRLVLMWPEAQKLLKTNVTLWQ